MVEEVDAVLLRRYGHDFDIAFIHLLGCARRLLAGRLDLAASIITCHLVALKLHRDGLRKIFFRFAGHWLVLGHAVEGCLYLLNFINGALVDDIGGGLQAHERLTRISV